MALGFLRQPRVRWLSPPILAKAAVEVSVSATFGKLADKREMETAPQAVFDYSGREKLWIDYLSDTGDGWEATCTMAWLLARDSLSYGELALPRGDVLLLGGDQVYPAPGEDGVAYEDRFLGPLSSASTGKATPDLFAIPGNHDWYDGLVSFLRIFCRPTFTMGTAAGDGFDQKAIGDWRPRQRRSYWGLRLPHDWWIWAIDIQFDTFIDNAQLEYFDELAQGLGEGHRVVLVTAKPSWVKAEPDQVAPASWRNLAYFERRMIRERGAELALTVSGDLHHYSRYEPRVDGAGPTRITAGGGGAYLSATHTLREEVKLVPAKGKAGVPYTRTATYPKRRTSRWLSLGILRVAWHNPGFASLLAAIYGLLGAAILGALSEPDTELVAVAQGSFPSFLSAAIGGTTIALALFLGAALYAYADFRRWYAKLFAGATHAAAHLVVAAAIAYFAAERLPSDGSEAELWLTALGAEAVLGFLFGSLLFAAYLLFWHWLRGHRAPKHTNEVFAGQGIRGYKNFLRLHFDRDGKLTVYPIGVKRVCTEWDLENEGNQPRLNPRGGAPIVEPADERLTFPRRTAGP